MTVVGMILAYLAIGTATAIVAGKVKPKMLYSEYGATRHSPDMFVVCCIALFWPVFAVTAGPYFAMQSVTNKFTKSPIQLRDEREAAERATRQLQREREKTELQHLKILEDARREVDEAIRTGLTEGALLDVLKEIEAKQ